MAGLMRHAAVTLLFAGTAFAALALPAFAQQPNLLGPQLAPPPLETPSPAALNAALPPPPAVPVDRRIAFDATERWMIPLYFHDVREKQKRAARSKKYPRALPEGLKEDPVTGDRLAPGMLARLEKLPGPLSRDLPPARPDTDRRIVGKNVLMIRTSTGEVLDVLPNIVY